MKNLADQYTQDYFKELEKADQVEYPRNARILDLIQHYVKTGTLLDIGVRKGLKYQDLMCQITLLKK